MLCSMRGVGEVKSSISSLMHVAFSAGMAISFSSTILLYPPSHFLLLLGKDTLLYPPTRAAERKH